MNGRTPRQIPVSPSSGHYLSVSGPDKEPEEPCLWLVKITLIKEPVCKTCRVFTLGQVKLSGADFHFR